MSECSRPSAEFSSFAVFIYFLGMAVYAQPPASCLFLKRIQHIQKLNAKEK
jgi:hypothetical protein